MLRIRTLTILTAIALMAGCVEIAPAGGPRGGSGAPASRPAAGKVPTTADLARFQTVAGRMEPVAEALCRARIPAGRCNFAIGLDPRAGLAPNAAQSRADNGRPLITFTRSLLADVRNEDELAFIMGHEAAHHILGHLDRTRDSAMAGALVGGVLGALLGGGEGAVSTAQNLGATVGARVYSKDLEIEADRLGAVLAFRAGFDPLVGVRYFSRIPDPGNSFLGSHPPNSARMQAVRQRMRQIAG